MSNKRKTIRGSDPRRLGGDMIGDRAPHEKAGVVLDTRRAVLLHEVDVSTVDNHGEFAIALLLAGRINRTDERVRTLYLMGSDGVAAIVTELLALLGRATGRDASSILTDITDRMNQLREEGNLT